MILADQSVDETCRAALDTWGLPAQLDIAVEECAELIKAICKVKRYPERPGLVDDLASEVADVAIMLVQLQIAYPALEGKLEAEIERKRARLEERIIMARGLSHV